MKIAVVLTAFDKMSSIVDRATSNAERRMGKLMKKNFAEGGAMMATGATLLKSLQRPVSAYAKLEDANADLQASMMDSTGAIEKNFEAVSNVAEGLGDKLPGTTADFYELFKAMMENGVKSQNILNGVGKAAAYLAVDLKMPMAAAGEFAARMKESTGVADEEMMGFLDTVSRLNSLGIGADEMRYAFSRASGTLKMLGLQGLQASNDMGVLYAQMIRVGGMSGETAGTSFNSIIQSLLDKKKFAAVNEEAKKLGVSLQFFKDGKFLGVENMVAQFDKLSKFDVNKRANLVQLITGGGQDAQAVNTIISQGVAGFAKLKAEMEAKASLNDKVNLKLKTLNAIWEATTGTIENMFAALGAGLRPVLGPIAEMIGSIAGKLKEWLSSYPGLAKFIMGVAALAGVFLTLMGAIKILQGIRIAMALLNITMKANPMILIASGIILAAGLIYANWTAIKDFFARLWQSIIGVFKAAWRVIKQIIMNHTPAGLIIRNWSRISGFFSNLWNNVKKIFSAFWGWLKSNGQMVFDVVTSPIRNAYNWVVNFVKGFYNAGKSIVMNIYNGIKDFFMWPVNKVKDMVGKIRKYLPFSPAKEGPLRDIHRIRLVETIAESIRPNSLVDKMRNVAKLTWAVINGRSGGPASVPSMVGRGGSSTVINFEINVSGGASKDDGRLIMAEIEKKLPGMLKRVQGQQTRVSFSN
ncbi:phage tail tape measure protein [Terrimonas sp. NA20]|uniref:Phage tail tape measure protein n=1 Tax=Terrimonas ginsenosidimutans TaxID=2908004 RepID=A0ABS9KRH8_9BACT|nr:phage tail tape measure protein [Terrimonas ginsenosidimutans]MCG2614897.1 phage tail tape measure protein [Terrimonas ginsenosidimutans]